LSKTLDDCIFCAVIAGKAPVYKIMENELSLGILDINPLAPGHCLVLPKRHVPWWHDLSEEEVKSLFSLARIMAQKIKQKFKSDFISLYARGRRIPHTHIFLIPTVSGDLTDRFFNALEKFQESPEELIKIKNSLELIAATLLDNPSI
jgi:histidine triad (HIT) family protein